MILNGFESHYQLSNVQIWLGGREGTSFTDNTNVTAWNVPLDCTMVHFFLMGGGGGGGTGQTSAAAQARGGGGGGGSGATMSLLIPRICLPDTVYVGVGSGGFSESRQGATTRANGSTGSPSYVNIIYNKGIGTSNLAQADAGGGGGGLQTLTGGAGGSAGLALTTPYWATSGIYSSTAGAAGGAGGGAGAGTATSFLAGGLTTGGAGGGGITGANGQRDGGAITLVDIAPVASAAGGTAGGGNGSIGTSDAFNRAFFPMPGAGGGTGTTVAGRGGQGSFGCGGGGGGSNTSGNVGPGGEGGPGMVVITWW